MVRPENIEDFESFQVNDLQVFIQKDLLKDPVTAIEFLIQSMGVFTIRFLDDPEFWQCTPSEGSEPTLGLIWHLLPESLEGKRFEMHDFMKIVKEIE